MDHLLATIGVPAGRIPPTIDERLALWRSEVADRKILVVLDNAPSSQVVKDLLPGSLTCAVLVTSRRQLVGLDAGFRISLDVLTAGQAAELLAQVVGADRTAGQEQASLELAERCGHLPLAIRIAGSRLRHRPSWTVEYLNAKLAAEDKRLDELSIDGRGIASAFAISYEQLKPEEQLVFRRLSLMPGRDADPYAAAALAGLTTDEADRVLEELVDANLLLQLSPGRFQFHDLVRQYAAELCATTDSADDRSNGTHRLIDYYAQTGRRAARMRRIDHLEGYPELPPVEGWTFASLQDAVAWAANEGSNLMAVVLRAKELGRDDAVLQLAVSTAPFLHQHGRLEDYETMLSEALDTARRLGNDEAEARIQLVYGRLLNVRKGPRQALPHLERAVELLADSTDARLRAIVLTALAYVGARLDPAYGWEPMIAEAVALAADHPRIETGALEVAAVLYGDRTDWANALPNYQRALENCRKTDDEEVVSDLLSGIAECYLGQNQPTEALAAALEAKDHALRLGLSHALPFTYAFIGTAYVELGEFDLGVQAHREAVETALHSGIRRSLAIARLRLGGSLLAAGQRSDSRYEFLTALELAKAEQLPHHIARAYAGLADCAEADDLPEHAVMLLGHAIEAVSEGWPDFAEDLRARQRALQGLEAERA